MAATGSDNMLTIGTEVDFNEFYEWWKEHLELNQNPEAGGLGALYAAKKRSFLGGDADVALMMAISSGREACEALLIDAGAEMDPTMKSFAQQQLKQAAVQAAHVAKKIAAAAKEEEKERRKKGLRQASKSAAADSDGSGNDGNDSASEVGFDTSKVPCAVHKVEESRSCTIS
eukprot:COSAG05_NODE_172_length_14980_cov_10.662791_3_plen_173_part_00